MRGWKSVKTGITSRSYDIEVGMWLPHDSEDLDSSHLME